MFTYTPRTIPGPPSSLRQQAYNEGSELLGPKVDPEGWEVLPDVVFQGTLFSILKVSFTCSVRLPLIREIHQDLRDTAGACNSGRSLRSDT